MTSKKGHILLTDEEIDEISRDCFILTNNLCYDDILKTSHLDNLCLNLCIFCNTVLKIINILENKSIEDIKRFDEPESYKNQFIKFIKKYDLILNNLTILNDNNTKLNTKYKIYDKNRINECIENLKKYKEYFSDLYLEFKNS